MRRIIVPANTEDLKGTDGLAKMVKLKVERDKMFRELRELVKEQKSFEEESLLYTYNGEDKEDACICSFIPDNKTLNPEDSAAKNEFKIKLRAAIVAALTEKECNVIIKRFGLDDGYCRTLEQIAAEYGCTRERIRQIESRAINRLKQNRTVISLISTYYNEFSKIF